MFIGLESPTQYKLGCPPRMPVANEGLVQDSKTKKCNPGGDWHPGRGDNPKYKHLICHPGDYYW